MNLDIGLINYLAALFLVLYGTYSMMTKENLVRKVISMSILQTGVILFFVSISVKKDAAIPILSYAKSQNLDPVLYANPLPHALMLTAIVVGVSTLGVALVLIVSIYKSHQSIEEPEILANIEQLDRSEDKTS